MDERDVLTEKLNQNEPSPQGRTATVPSFVNQAQTS